MTTRNDAFTRLAHRRTVLLVLQKHLKDNYIELDGEPKEALVCEDVMYADRIVSQEALLDVLDGLQQLEAMESLGMSEFEFKKRDIPPLRLPAPPKDPNAQATVASASQPDAPGKEASPHGDATPGGATADQPGAAPGPAGGPGREVPTPGRGTQSEH